MENINLRFVDSTKSFYRIHPIQRAASVDPAHKDFQVKQHGRETFVDCPGMFDYKNTGWILTAWDEFTVYASKNATMAYAGNDNKRPGGSLPTPIKDGCPHMTAPNLMSADITDGIPNAADNSETVYNLYTLLVLGQLNQKIKIRLYPYCLCLQFIIVI